MPGRVLVDVGRAWPTGRRLVLNDGRTQLYQLIDFEPRRQEAVGRRYLDGWYGTKPIISPAEFEAAVDAVQAAVD